MASQMVKTKRKRTSYSLKMKLDVYKRIKDGIAPSIVATEFAIPRSSVSVIKSSGPKMEAFLLANPRLDFRRTMKSASFPELDKALKLFFDGQRALGKPISGALLQEKAKIFLEKLSPPIQVKTSNNLLSLEDIQNNSTLGGGFIHKFKLRHGIRNISCVGEKESANKDSVNPFLQSFNYLTKDLTRDQIYNVDETGLCWRAIPTKTLAGPNELRADGSKIDKERVTLMACANASGNHKLELVFIYKYQNPRALKHINKDKLPVVYYSQPKAWMTTELFDNWFHNHFIPAVSNYLKELGLEGAVLTMDNAPSHTKFSNLRSSADTKINCLFFPPNTTSILQPMDQGVLDTLKRHYRKKIMRNALLNEDNVLKNMSAVKKSITIKDAIVWAAEAWAEVKTSTIQSSWNLILPHLDSPQEGDKEITTSDDVEDENASSDCFIDEDAGGEMIELNDEEIIELVQNEEHQEPIDDGLTEVPHIVPIIEATTMLRSILPTLESELESSKEEILVFQRVLTRWMNSPVPKPC